MTNERAARTRAWLLLQRFRWRAVILHSSSQFLTITLGGLSVAVGFWTIMSESLREQPLVLVALVFLPAVVGWFVTLHTMPPGLYAQALVDGQREMTILLVIAGSIDWLCDRFLRGISRDSKISQDLRTYYENHASSPPSARNSSPASTAAASGEAGAERPGSRDTERGKLAKRLARQVQRVERLIHRHHRHIRRLEEMKLAAARELDVHHRRLCDHVLQFSPTIFREGTWRYLDTWRLLLELVASEERDAAKSRARAHALLRQVSSLEDDCRKRRIYQEQLLRFAFLHEAIIGFAGSHSTSGSLREYASAISHLARHYRQRLDRQRWLPWQRPWLQEASECLAFVYRKQRAHPGFDLHTLLETLCDLRTPEAGVEAGHAFDQQRALAMAVDGKPKHRQPLTQGQLDALALLHLDVQAEVSAARDAIAKHMQRLFARRNRTLFVVTNGYSKTVREVLGLLSLDNSTQAYLLLAGSEQHLATRIMKSEVKHSREDGGGIRTRGRIACGNLEMLLGLLGTEHSVLLLLGAECYDGQGRLAHARGMGTAFRRLTAHLTRHEIPHLVVAVAERYKKVEPELASSRFYTDHFDGVDIYPPGSVDLIISDAEELWPARAEALWDAVFAKVKPAA